MLNISIRKYDSLGALARGLCMIHCIATPFLFIASACTVSCCSTTPLWWQWVDYAFLGISLFAVINASKSSANKFIKYGLWISWTGLFLFLLNAKFLWFTLSINLKYIPALSLVSLHIYNLRFGKCKNDECC